MPIDTNEIGGFVRSCPNAAYLYNLMRTIQDRLQELGHTGGYGAPPATAPPEPVQVVGGYDEEGKEQPVTQEDLTAAVAAMVKAEYGDVIEEALQVMEKAGVSPEVVAGEVAMTAGQRALLAAEMAAAGETAPGTAVADEVEDGGGI